MVYYLPQSPYYDDYNEDNKYLQILAKPSFPEQAREFTQAQTMLLDHIGRVADVLLTAGDIVSGMSCHVAEGGKVTIDDGSIFISDLILKFDSQTVTIPVTGKSSVGAKVSYKVVTATEDSSLRDPAQGVTNSGQPGADRVQYEVTLTVDDPTATELYKFQDGELAVIKERPDLTGINAILARRTYDESGNYKVNGLEVMQRNPALYPDDKSEYVTLSEGKAYVKGFEVTKPVSTAIPIRFADDLTTSSNELKRYVQGQKSYTLNNKSVKSIIRVTMDVNSIKDVTRNNTSSIDVLTLQNESVSTILRVWQNDVEYVYGKDYVISSSQNGIDWNPTPASGTSPSAGKSPATGSTYKIDVVILQNISQNYYTVATTDKGEVLTFTDNAPVPYYKENSQFIGTFTVEYSFYYSRQDLIMIDRFGDIHVLEGIPNVPDALNPPINQNTDLLNLAYVVVSKTGVIAIYNIADMRTTMSDIIRIASRVNTLERNVAITNLDREAQEGEDASLLSGIYTDGFLNVQKADIGHNEFKCAIDLDNQEVTTQAQSTVFDLTINENDSSTQYIGRVISAPFNHSPIIEQLLATKKMLVNPYAQFNAMGFVELTPAVDTWIDEELITSDKTTVKNTTLRRWWNHKDEDWADADRQKWTEAGFENGGQNAEQNGNLTGINKQVASSTKTSLIAHMRQKEVQVKGTNFGAYADNILCYFDNVKVNVTATGSSVAGSTSGSIKADAKGSFTCKFTVPANVLCGTVNVEFRNSDNTGATSYTASGTKRTTTKTTLTTITNVSLVDPLAQSFQFTEDRILTRAGIFIAVKDKNLPIIVEIRNTVNGYPGQICYDRILVNPEDIVVSENGTAETIIDFNQPVYCEANTMYAIAILSDSNVYQTFVAELGQKDILSGNIIGSQPHNGTLFSSSNAQTWTAHQREDLKFKLYEAVYNRDGGVIIFDDVATSDVSSILLATDYIDKKNAGITWEYSTDNGVSWDNLENYSEQDVKYAGIKKVKLKATIKVSSNTSPLMAKDNISLVTFLSDVDMTYVGRNVQLDQPYKQVSIEIDTNSASTEGVSHKVYFASDASGTTWVELTNPSIRPVNSQFNRYTYTYDVPQTQILTNYRHKLVMSTVNPLIRPRASRLISIMRT